MVGVPPHRCVVNVGDRDTAVGSPEVVAGLVDGAFPIHQPDTVGCHYEVADMEVAVAAARRLERGEECPQFGGGILGDRQPGFGDQMAVGVVNEWGAGPRYPQIPRHFVAANVGVGEDFGGHLRADDHHTARLEVDGFLASDDGGQAVRSRSLCVHSSLRFATTADSASSMVAK